MPRLLTSVLFASFALSLTLFAPSPGHSQEAGTEQQRAAFQKMLDGASLEGKFTVVGPSGMMERDDLYSVSTLKPAADGSWVFEYRMSYGGNDGADAPALEIPVDVVFAGDTAMITMTEQEVPGLGTFSVRLLFYDDLYAGTWANGPVGGHMWGQIVRDAGGATAAPDGP